MSVVYCNINRFFDCCQIDSPPITSNPGVVCGGTKGHLSEMCYSHSYKILYEISCAVIVKQIIQMNSQLRPTHVV